MQPKKAHAKLGREKLQRIIEMCMSIENRSLDPFLLNVDEIIAIIRDYFPDWETPEDLCLDAETLHRLASVIRLQSEWVKQRSTSLYTDPFLLEEKIQKTSSEEMVEVFLQSWHPIIALEQISIHSIREAIRYWDSLLPLKERWKEFPVPEAEAASATREELVKQRILADKAFSEELEKFWTELKISVQEKGADGKILYWDFVGAETYEESVARAFMTSFLVTYGYATLEIHPLEEEIYIRPYETPMAKISKKQLVSIPIAVRFEDWQKWRRGELE